MTDFDRIVDGIALEPLEVSSVRELLRDDWDEKHPDSPDRETAHSVIDEMVDCLRVLWGAGVFDTWAQTAPQWIAYVGTLRGVVDGDIGSPE